MLWLNVAMASHPLSGGWHTGRWESMHEQFTLQYHCTFSAIALQGGPDMIYHSAAE
jgi:hypothetical protein